MVKQCDANDARFLELAESTLDDMVARLCDPQISGSSRSFLVVDNFCKSREL